MIKIIGRAILLSEVAEVARIGLTVCIFCHTISPETFLFEVYQSPIICGRLEQGIDYNHVINGIR